ncbi:MAG TPA: HAD-IIIA family hydrolase [Longimicrobiales bacterium]
MRPAVFLDRDGVLNRVVPRDGRPGSPRTPAEFVLCADAAAALDRLRHAGYLLFVVTNQPDVARGLLAPEDLDTMMRTLAAALPVDDARICRHDDDDGCACRKPRHGMITDLAAAWAVDLPASFMVGDGWRDIAAGRAAGCRTVLLRRAYNADVRADYAADTLIEAAELILAAGRPGG